MVEKIDSKEYVFKVSLQPSLTEIGNSFRVNWHYFTNGLTLFRLF
jgi:hypothetical protein